MAAIGQPGGAAPPAAGAPAPTPGAPAPTPGAAPAADPWGFNAAVNNAPEHLRPMLQQELQRIAPTLDARLQPLAPVEPYMERLGPLLQADPQGAVPLEGLINLYELFNADDSTPEGAEQLDALADWWDSVGEHFGFFDDEPGGNGGNGGEPTPPGQPGQIDLDAIEDPGLRSVVGAIMQQNEAMRAELGEFKNTLTADAQQRQLNEQAQAIQTDLQTRMKAAGIEGHDDLKSPNAIDIMRIALSYGEDPEAIEKAVADYQRLTGRAPASTPANPQLDGAAALQAALNGGVAAAPSRPSPGPSLGRGNADTEPESVSGWEDARSLALQRLREAERA